MKRIRKWLSKAMLKYQYQHQPQTMKRLAQTATYSSHRCRAFNVIEESMLLLQPQKAQECAATVSNLRSGLRQQ